MDQLSGSAPHQSASFTPSQVHSASQKVPYKGKDTESTDGKPVLSVLSNTFEGMPAEQIRDRVTQRLDSPKAYTLHTTYYEGKPSEVIPETPETQQARLALDERISEKCNAKMQLNSAKWVNADDSENLKLLQTFTLSTNPDKHPTPATPETQKRQLDFQKAISENVGADVKLLTADWILDDKNKADLPTQPIQISHQKIREDAKKQVQEAAVELELQQNRLAAMTLTSGLTEETPVGATPYPKSEDNRSRDFRRHQAQQQLRDVPGEIEKFKERLQSLKSEFGVESYRDTLDSNSLRREPIFQQPELDTDDRLSTGKLGTPSDLKHETGDWELHSDDLLTTEAETRAHTGLEDQESLPPSRDASLPASRDTSRPGTPSGLKGEPNLESTASDQDEMFTTPTGTPPRAATPDITSSEQLLTKMDEPRITERLKAEQSLPLSRDASLPASRDTSRPSTPSGLKGETGDLELHSDDLLTTEAGTRARTGLEDQESLPPSRDASLPASRDTSRPGTPPGLKGETGDLELHSDDLLTTEAETRARTGLEDQESLPPSRDASLPASRDTSRPGTPSGLKGEPDLESTASDQDEMFTTPTGTPPRAATPDITSSEQLLTKMDIDEPLISSSSEEKLDSIEDGLHQTKSELDSVESKLQELSQQQTSSHGESISTRQRSDSSSSSSSSESKGSYDLTAAQVDEDQLALSSIQELAEQSSTATSSDVADDFEEELGVTSEGDKRIVDEDEKEQFIERTEQQLEKQPASQFVSQTIQFTRTPQSKNDEHLSSEVDPMGGTEQSTEATLATGESSLESLSRSQERVTDETLETISQELRKEHGTSTDETDSKASVKGTPQHQEVFTPQPLDTEVLDTEVTVQKQVITITEEGNESLKSLFSDHEKMEDSSTFEMMTREITTTETTIRETTTEPQNQAGIASEEKHRSTINIQVDPAAAPGYTHELASKEHSVTSRQFITQSSHPIYDQLYKQGVPIRTEAATSGSFKESSKAGKAKEVVKSSEPEGTTRVRQFTITYGSSNTRFSTTSQEGKTLEDFEKELLAEVKKFKAGYLSRYEMKISYSSKAQGTVSEDRVSGSYSAAAPTAQSKGHADTSEQIVASLISALKRDEPVSSPTHAETDEGSETTIL